jgi:hypothetical protein
MGSLQAQEMKDWAPTIEVALGWHLQSNHYPPVSTKWIEPAMEAIELANCGLWKESIQLLEKYGFRAGKGQETLTVGEIVEGLHLDFWIESEEYYDE